MKKVKNVLLLPDVGGQKSDESKVLGLVKRKIFVIIRDSSTSLCFVRNDTNVRFSNLKSKKSEIRVSPVSISLRQP